MFATQHPATGLSPARREQWFGRAARAAIVVAAVSVWGGGCALIPNRLSCENPTPNTASSAQNPCLYDPASRTYKECFHVTADGRCTHFGTPCSSVAATQSGTPPATCLYDSVSGTNRTCYHVTADGGCAHFGEPCIP